MMYVRLAVLLALFDRRLSVTLAPRFLILAGTALGAGWLWSRRGAQVEEQPTGEAEPDNPLELRAAFGFAFLFVAMLIVSHLVAAYLGSIGVLSLAVIMGVTDVDPFILSITQAASGSVPAELAGPAIVIAAASNNVAKGLYAFGLAPRAVGKKSLLLLIGLAVAGLVPLIW
jgi:uncharacterized membrane protein (DUF4010 family)